MQEYIEHQRILVSCTIPLGIIQCIEFLKYDKVDLDCLSSYRYILFISTVLVSSGFLPFLYVFWRWGDDGVSFFLGEMETSLSNCNVKLTFI